MSPLRLAPGAFALAFLASAGPAAAATDAELAEIRAQIRELKESYEARIKALEDRLKDAESRAAAQPVASAPPLPAPSAASPSSAASAFNPAVSVVLNGTYANLSQDPSRFRIAGFPAGGDIGPGRRSFSLGESELALYANVDHLFSGNLIFSITPDNRVSVEEANAIYTGAPAGVTPKFGRFFSAQGYLNEQHAHAWDFVDAPLAYQAFLGGQYQTDGVQVKWVAPLEQYVEVGGELGNGDAFPGTPRNKNGTGAGVLYARTGGDIGESHSWLAGLSWLDTRASDREWSQPGRDGADTSLAFTGRSRLAIADFVWKYAPNGNPHITNFKLQGEYLWRRESGDLAVDSAVPASYSARQSGWYVQGVYQFMPMWRVGARYDRLAQGSVDYGANAALLDTPAFDPRRASVMLDWSPSEFSRVRLQFAQSKTVPGATDNEWFLQYILSIGAHGAHKY